VTPVFPFGHGLSYTTFSYDSLNVKRVENPTNLKSAVAEVTLNLSNTGKRDGTEVVQLYLAFPRSALGEPPKQLKNFGKVALRASQSSEVKFTLTQRDISTWDSEAHAWAPVKGEFGILIGASSADIRLSQNIVL
jgi:beta-glucosidase